MSSKKHASENPARGEQENELADKPAKLSMADLLALKKQRVQSHPVAPKSNSKAKKVGDGPRGSRRSMGKR